MNFFHLVESTLLRNNHWLLDSGLKRGFVTFDMSDFSKHDNIMYGISIMGMKYTIQERNPSLKLRVDYTASMLIFILENENGTKSSISDVNMINHVSEEFEFYKMWYRNNNFAKFSFEIYDPKNLTYYVPKDVSLRYDCPFSRDLAKRLNIKNNNESYIEHQTHAIAITHKF